ncbi:hypothetical protein [Carnobacterium divergens]|uniref:hypothetical protein n=1 Tax=Carnobacterium divergens TaxID=2748 RepID=UPI0039AEDC75
MKIIFESSDMNEQMLDYVAEKILVHLNKTTFYNNKNQSKQYMNITQTAEYMNVSSNTLKSKFIPLGLNSVLTDGIERFDKTDCDRFMEAHKR